MDKPKDLEQNPKRDEGKRNQDHRRVLAIVMCVLLAVAIAASLLVFRKRIQESSDLLVSVAGREYDGYYVLVTDNADSDFWQGVLRGAKNEAEKNNIYLEMVTERMDTDYNRYDKMGMAVYAGVDGIILDAADNQVMADLIHQASLAGIPVVTVRNDCQASERVSFVNISYANLSREYAKLIRRLSKKKLSGGVDKVRVCVLLDADDTSGQNIILTGIQDNIAAAGLADSIEIATRQIHNNSVFSAEEEIRDLFLYSENQIPGDIIVCLNTSNTTCVYQTVLDYNLVGRIDILGFYESETIKNAIDKDIIQASVTVDTEQMGRYCVEALSEYRDSGYVSDYYAVEISVLGGEKFSSKTAELQEEKELDKKTGGTQDGEE